MSRDRLESLLLSHLENDDCPQSVCGAVQRQQKGAVLRPNHVREKPLRVLVADDNADVADSFSMLVKFWGHDAQSAYDGAAALEIADVYQPDVMLLDIAMPGMNGFQLAQRLRNQPRFKDILLIAITGYSDRAHRLLWQAAFDHFLIKPVEPAVLKALLRAHVDRQALSTSTDGYTHANSDSARVRRTHATSGGRNERGSASTALLRKDSSREADVSNSDCEGDRLGFRTVSVGCGLKAPVLVAADPE